MAPYNTTNHAASHFVCKRHVQKCQLMKYCNLICAATIVAVTQVLPVIVTRPSRFAHGSGYARLATTYYCHSSNAFLFVHYNY